MSDRNCSDTDRSPDLAGATVVSVGGAVPSALAGRWTVSDASGVEDALGLAADADVVALDADATGREARAVPGRLARRDSTCRALLVARDPPPFDPESAGYDECLVSPTTGELERAVERALTLSVHAEAVRSYFDAVRRRERLRALGDAERSAVLRREIRRRRERADRAVTGLGAAEYRALFRDLDGTDGQASSS